MADEPRSFLGRWSRRKLAARQPPAPPPAPEPSTLEAGEPEGDLPAPDLPAIETLDAGSDYSVFLQSGVAADIQRLALQRAWATDDKIAAFRGMAEYDWDFNATGYGRLWESDNVAKLVAEILAPPEPVPDAEPPPAIATAEAAPEPEPPHEPEAEPPAPAPTRPTRRHGGAMPG